VPCQSKVGGSPGKRDVNGGGNQKNVRACNPFDWGRKRSGHRSEDRSCLTDPSSQIWAAQRTHCSVSIAAAYIAENGLIEPYGGRNVQCDGGKSEERANARESTTSPLSIWNI
jgi:hypothetical protein